VLITEKFQESLVMLSRLLCWPLEDFVFLSQRKKVTKHARLSSADKRKLKLFLKPEFMLYDHFRQKLNKQLDMESQSRMRRDLKKLSKLSQTMIEPCQVREYVASKDDTFKVSVSNSSSRECQWMAMSAPHLRLLVAQSMKERLTK